MTQLSFASRIRRSIGAHLSTLRTMRRGYNNILDVWPLEVFEKTVCVFKMLRRTIFVVSDPVWVEYVMLTRVENFRKSDASRQMLEPLIGRSMFITHGDHWRRQRRIATPAFHSRHVRRFVPTMAEETLTLLTRWESQKGGDEIDVSSAMTGLTADIICRTLFSHDITNEAIKQVYAAFSRYQDSLGRLAVTELTGLPSWLPKPGVREGRKAVSELDDVVWQIIAARRASGAKNSDLLGLLLEAVDPETGEGLSDDLIRDELMFLFLAGHETTASAMVWTWYLLSQAPEAERRLHDELDEVLGGRVPDYEDLGKLPWLRAVLKEAMRLYPPVHVYSREAVEDDEIAGQFCPAGAMVVVSPWVVHRHHALWEDPAQFNPERFMDGNDADRSRYAWIPFGAGPRLCLGMGFAMNEMLTAAALIAQRYRLRLRPGHRVAPLGRLTLRPSEGLPMLLEARSGPGRPTH